jgi:hypothetical protein
VLYAVLDRKAYVKSAAAVSETPLLTTPAMPPLALRKQED